VIIEKILLENPILWVSNDPGISYFRINKIKQKQFDIFIEKFYQKKVEQMTRVLRNVAKFKRIYYNEQDNSQEDILNDQKMKKIVEEFKDKKNKYMNNLNF